MGFENVGKVWDVSGFRDFLRGQEIGWAQGVTLHHTAAPSLAQRPQGFKIQHMRNLQHFYQTQLGWSAGPHLFVDEDQVFGLSGLHRRGVHAKSFNRTHIGIEVLGNYDSEDPTEGRGLQCWTTAAAAVSALLERLGKGISAVNFHRDDPRTSKTCPGRLVERDWVLALIPQPSDRTDDPPGDAASNLNLEPELRAMEWQLRKIRDKLG
jgi:hypothetical protein